MILKNKISDVFRQTFYYALKVWFVNICFFVLVTVYFFDTISNSFWDFKIIIALAFFDFYEVWNGG